MKRFLIPILLAASPALAAPLELSGCQLAAEQIPGMTVVDCQAHSAASTAVATVHYRVTLADPARSVPWLDAKGGTTIPGGIEPGETVTVSFVVARTVPDGHDPAALVPGVEILKALDVEGHPIP